METPHKHDAEIPEDEGSRDEPRTESGSGDLDEDALEKGQDKLDQAAGGH